MLQTFLNDQVNIVCKKYKISEDEAHSFTENALAGNTELANLVNQATDLKKVYRTRTYKDFIKKLKKDIYFGLRTYQKEGAGLAESHISTAERQSSLDKFYNQIETELSECERVLDLGGGMFPATFPFERFENITEFVWVDKDKKSFEKLQGLQEKKLTLANTDLRDFKFSGEYDFTFMLKLIPVVARQEKDLLKKLAALNSKYILLTGSKEAMVKKQDISKREDRILQEFIKTTGATVVKKIDIANEFGYLLKRG